jgi:hypothetical protein
MLGAFVCVVLFVFVEFKTRDSHSTMLRLDRYDNEAGYSKRMAELCNIVAAQNITKTTPAFQYE